MERLMIQIPEKKSALIKSLLKELGAVIETDTNKTAKKLDSMVLPGPAMSLDEIAEEVRLYRSGK